MKKKKIKLEAKVDFEKNYFEKELCVANFQELFSNLVDSCAIETTSQTKKESKKSLTDYAINPAIIKKNLIDEDDSY